MVALLSELVPGLTLLAELAPSLMMSSFEVANNYQLGVWKP